MSGLEQRFLAEIPFVTTAAGTLVATVDWTFPESDLDIYLVQGRCTIAQFNSRTCTYAAFSESFTAKPERIEFPNAPAGSYALYVGNYSGQTESFSYQVVLTSTAFATGRSATAVSASGAKRGEVRGMIHE